MFVKNFLELTSKCSLKESLRTVEFYADEIPIIDYIEVAKTVELSHIDIYAINSFGEKTP